MIVFRKVMNSAVAQAKILFFGGDKDLMCSYIICEMCMIAQVASSTSM